MTGIEIDKFRAALAAARSSFESATKRLEEITRESNKLNRELLNLRRTITALAATCSESPLLDPLGITEACEELMAIEYRELNTVGVVVELERMGFDVGSQKNAAASVHAVLSRLAAKNKIEKIVGDNDTVTWRGPNYTELTDDDIPF